MKLQRTGAIWNRDNRNGINSNWERIETVFKNVDELVIEGKLTPDEYAEIIASLNGLVKSGNVDMSDLTPEFKGKIEGFDTQLAQKVTKGNVTVADINKNKGKFDQTYLSDELLQQMAGNTPINAVPADRSLTTEKAAKGAWTRNELSENFMDSGQITESINTVFSDGFYMVDEGNSGTFPEGEVNDNNWTLEVKTLSSQWCHQTLAKRTQPHIRYLRRIRTTTNEVTPWVKILNDSEGILNRQLSDNFLYRGIIPSETSIDDVYSDGTYFLNNSNIGTFPYANDKSSWVMEVFTVERNWTVQTLIKRVEPNIRYTRAIRNDIKDLYPWTFIGTHKSNPENPENKTFKMLMVGNSYDLDVTEYLAEIAASAGINVKIGVLYRAGERLSVHYDNAINDNKNYAYHIRSSADGTASREVISDVSISDAVVSDDWDVITFHQSPSLSGDYSSYQPYLNDLQLFINDIVTNNHVKFALLQTWAYATSVREEQSVMYEGIVDAGKQSMKDADIGIFIPCGSAIQSARGNAELTSKDDELTEDGSHLSELGDYIAGLTIFHTLLSGRYKKDIDSDVTFKPSSVTNYQMYLSKLVAKNAAIKPFGVSDIK